MVSKTRCVELVDVKGVEGNIVLILNSVFCFEGHSSAHLAAVFSVAVFLNQRDAEQVHFCGVEVLAFVILFLVLELDLWLFNSVENCILIWISYESFALVSLFLCPIPVCDLVRVLKLVDEPVGVRIEIVSIFSGTGGSYLAH